MRSRMNLDGGASAATILDRERCVCRQRAFRIVLAAAVLGILPAPKANAATSDDETVRDAKLLASTATSLFGAYGSAKSATDVATKLLQELGWIQSDPSVTDQIKALNQTLNDGFGAVIWAINSNQAQDQLTEILTAKQLLVYDPTNPNMENDILLALNFLTAGDPSQMAIYHRQYRDKEDGDLLKKLNFNTSGQFSKADMDPQPNNPSLVYDWRMGVPVLMTAIAYRMQIIAYKSSDFRTSGKYRLELDQYRTALLWHYNMMLKGIKCGPYSWTCVDLHSGLFQSPDYGGAPIPTSGFLGVYAVRATMPLYEVKAMIDLLYLYENAPANDLTEGYHRLPSGDYNGTGWCLEVNSKLTTPGSWPVLDICNGSAAQQWVYDRNTGTIRNSGTVVQPATGQCLGLNGGTDVFAVGVADCSGSRSQQWTYDPSAQVLVNAMGTRLATDWSSIGRPPEYLAVYRVHAATAAPGQLWQTDKYVSGMTPFSDTLKTGETLNKGQSRISKNNLYELILQNDGNLVLYHKVSSAGQERPAAVWASNTNGISVSGALMQSDGNLVIYTPPPPCLRGQICNPFPLGTVVWSSRTSGHSGANLVVQNRGDAVIYQQTTAIWMTDPISVIIY